MIFTDDLREARAAWRAKLNAEHELARLRRYTHLSPAMKADQARHARSLTEAEATLARVLGAAP